MKVASALEGLIGLIIESWVFPKISIAESINASSGQKQPDNHWGILQAKA